MSNTERTYISRPEAVKMAKAIAAKNPDYSFRSSECSISVTDGNKAHLVPFTGDDRRGLDGNYVSGLYFLVFCVRSSGKRTRAEIAAGKPILYWIEQPERHWSAPAPAPCKCPACEWVRSNCMPGSYAEPNPGTTECSTLKKSEPAA